jgi:hypothetical protein
MTIAPKPPALPDTLRNREAAGDRPRRRWRGLTWNQGLLLGVGAIVAGLVGVIAWTLWPAPPGPTDIRGRWRPADAPSCEAGRILSIETNRMTVSAPALSEGGTPLSFETALEQSTQGPLLRLYLEGQPRTTSILLRLDTHGNRLRFVSADWAEAAKAADGADLSHFPLAQLLHQLQKLQPMVPCP